jgi:biotin carboxyl carrier protein
MEKKDKKTEEQVAQNQPANTPPDAPAAPVGKRNPAEVEIVEPEEINDFYDFVDFEWEGLSYNTTLPKKYTSRKRYEVPNPKMLKAFIPGTIQKVFVVDGAKVKQNEKLLILEAMKMKNNIVAPFAGVVKKVYVKQSQQVTKNELLIELV